ncbi:MAG TPA: adenylate/guanylate cyclase domain-containing protein, partial [Planctomycetaceae bacterium]|nr:adenylate/guanylate cyclase domain-containing protein [Planctomycetaceae bacterium]
YLFDLFGDTVNTAARMESHGVKGQIILSNDARLAVDPFCDLTELDPTAVKGKGIVPRFRFDRFRPGITQTLPAV